MKRQHHIISRGIVLATAMATLSSAACSPGGGFKITPVPADQSLRERMIERSPGWVSDRVAVIDISGILMNAEEFELFAEGEHVVSQVVEQLDAAANDGRVKAVVLRINSPGGTVTASDILYEEIKAFREKTGKPVVAFFQDVAASGGYYLACAADEIIAQRTSVTGSIGVIMQMVDLTGTLAKLGIKAEAITSGAFKDAGSPLRPMKAEERAVFQAMIDGFHQQFVAVVDEGRPGLDREGVVKLADGRVYIAEQALEAGLIDGIGTIHDAVAAAKERAGVERAHVVTYRRPLTWTPNIYAQGPGRASLNVNLLNIEGPWDWTIRPRFLYIWDYNNRE